MSGSGSYSRSMKFLLAIILSSITTPSLSAHPHVFVDTGLELIVEGRGQLTHVRVTWEYDEFYSLLITEDLSLDPDGDGILTEAEITKLKGFDMQWIEGFNDDLVVANGDTLATLSDPRTSRPAFPMGASPQPMYGRSKDPCCRAKQRRSKPTTQPIILPMRSPTL